MRKVVRDSWVQFNEPYEGRVRHFYNDVKGLVTIGVGNLVDPIELALSLPMYRMDGVAASAKEIRDDWNAVKQNPFAAKLGHRFAAKLTRLRMRDEDIDKMVLEKLDANDTILKARFSEFEAWPADAQMAIHSLAWACGPNFSFPRLQTALRKKDFTTASKEVFMNEKGNPGLKPRNEANKLLLENAQQVVWKGLDPDVLYWPQRL